MKGLKYIAALMVLAGTATADAQYNQNIAVDGTYIPQVVSADRLGLYPQAVKFPMESSALQYSLRGVDASFTPQAQALPASGWQSSKLFSSYRGYVDLGLGSWLNANLSAGYRFVDNKNTTAGIYLQHNSSSLWHPRLSVSTLDRRMWHYDETLGVFVSHLFDGTGRLGAAIDYHLGYFNYYSFNPDKSMPEYANKENSAEDCTQTLNDISGRISWESTDDNAFSYAVNAGVRYFGFRTAYIVSPGTSSLYQNIPGSRETHANLSGNLGYQCDDTSSIGMDVSADLLAYNDLTDIRNTFNNTASTYGAVSLTPAYRYQSRNFNLQAGARVDLTMNGRDYYDNRYNTFRIAPMVKVDYTTGPFAVWLHATGGNTLHTLAGEYSSDYYTLPALLSTAPTYKPIDARIGFELGSFSGFSVAVEESYAANLGVYTGGLYSLYRNNALAGAPYVEQRYDARGFSTLLRLRYDAGKWFKITAEGTLNPGSIKKAYFNGYDHAKYTAKVSVESNPWSTLKFNLDYNFRGKRDIAYYIAEDPDAEALTFTTERLHNLNMLNFGVSYGITDAISVWGRAENLLNRHDAIYPELPTQGISLSAGISVLF